MTEGRDGGQATPAGSTGSPPSFRSGELSDPKLTAALRTLELTVRRRLDGVLHGDHLGLIPGPGSEPGDAREYQPGDDVRQMDWSVTARTTHPHVRQSVADRELETWLVIDLSASLDFGTAGCEKRDLVVAAAAAITHLTSSGGNRVGAIISTGAQTTRIPARGGRIHAQAMLRKIATTPHAPDGVRGDLVGAIEALRRPQRRRGLAVVISDFLGPIDWERSLRAISGRHDVLGVEVVDPRDLELPTWATWCSTIPSPAGPENSPRRRNCAPTSPESPPSTASRSGKLYVVAAHRSCPCTPIGTGLPTS